MKAKKITWPWILPLVAGTITLSSVHAQQLSTTEWSADPEEPGNWEDPESWSDGVPVADSLAGILNGGTVDVTSPTAILEQLHVSEGSILNIGSTLQVKGTNQINNPDPDPPTPPTGFYVNEGTINVISGGDFQVDTGGNFHLGVSAVADLNLLPGGTLTIDRAVNLGNGADSFGTLTLSGGELFHTGANFLIGSNNAVGQLNISDGIAVINTLRVNSGGSNASQINIVNQTGGEVTLNGETGIGWATDGSATYNLEDGTITTGNRIRIGVSNRGSETRVNTFNMTGGSVEVTGRIDIGDGSPPEVVNIYDMSGGFLSTTSSVRVGAFGTASGILLLRGLANIDLEGLIIGAQSNNTGTVAVEDEAFGVIDDFQVRNGTYTQSDELSNIAVTRRLWVGAPETVSNTATFNLIDGTLELSGGDIVGNGNTGDATMNIEGGSITSFQRLRVGNGAANGSLTPTNLVNQTGGDVTIFGRLDLGENPGPTNIYQISGGSLATSDRVLVGFNSDGTGTFIVDGTADVDVLGVVMGENAGTNITGTKGTVKLLGGVLTTGGIQVGNGETADQTLILDGGTIRARMGGSTLIAGNVTTASLLAGGITFDTDGLDVSTAGIMTGPGGIIKTGAGTLTVNGVQAYTGATRVEEGTLRLTQPYLADNGDVYLTTGAVLELDHLTTDNIGTLYVDGVPQAGGTYGGSGSGADTELDGLITGAGMLNSMPSTAPTDPPVITSITVAAGVATITISGAPNTTYTCRFSDDLMTSFAPITTDPETITTDGNGDATFTVDASVDRRFYVVGTEE